MANTYTLISSNILSVATSSITFSSIPSTYTDLVLRMSVRGSDTNLATRFRLNGDTATNYSLTDLIGQGSTVLNNRVSNDTEMNTTRTNQDNSGWTANTFTSIEVYLPNYLVSQNKPLSSISAAENNSATVNNIDCIAGLWRNTAAITSVSIYSSVGNFVANSSFYLYGIKSS